MKNSLFILSLRLTDLFFHVMLLIFYHILTAHQKEVLIRKAIYESMKKMFFYRIQMWIKSGELEIEISFFLQLSIPAGNLCKSELISSNDSRGLFNFFISYFHDFWWWTFTVNGLLEKSS